MCKWRVGMWGNELYKEWNTPKKMDEHFPRKEETRERTKYYFVKWYELNLLMRDWSSDPPKEGFILDCCSK